MKLIKLTLCAIFIFTIQKTQGQITMKISEKQIQRTKVINSSLDSLWWKWTTHEGLLSFFGRDNKIELTPGGAYEIYFLIDNPYGSKGGEGNKVLSFLPKQMLSFTWNAPPEFKEIRESDYRTWVVVNFKTVSATQTEVTLTHLGWPEDKNWDPVFEYFNDSWDIVLKWLDDSCKK